MANFSHGASSSGGRRESPQEKINAACSSLTVDEWQEKINAACSPLIEIGFSPELFTIKNLHEYGYTEIGFLEFIEPISSITSLDDLRHLFDTAREAVFLSTFVITPIEFREFINCMNWLNGELAKKNRADAILEKKNPQKKKEMSKADVVVAESLLGYAASVKKMLKSIESEVDELKERQKELERESTSIKIDVDELIKERLTELERESESITDDLKEKLGPIYDYKEPSLTELRTEAYKVYVADCRFKGITAIAELDEMGYAKVVDEFGGIVKERHFLKFLNDPVRIEKIENFIENFDFGLV